MQYDIDGGNITVVIGEEARMDVPTALNYIKSGQDEIEATVNSGIDAFDLNAANKTTDYNDNASAKVTAYNDNATAKTDAFDLNASNKTNDFNDNYTIKKGLIDASVDAAAGSASAASASADLAQQWAVKMDGKVADEDYSAKYYADLASQSAGATGANKDLSNLTAAGEARFTAKQDVISDLSTIRSGAALGDTSVQLSGAQTITGAKTFTQNVVRANTNITKGTNPSSKTYCTVEFTDKNGGGTKNRVGVVESAINTNGDIETLIGAYKYDNNSTTVEKISVIYPKTGNPYTFAPRPTDTTTSSGTQIATTGWVNSGSNNVVHKSADETIAGTKTFSYDPYIKNASAQLYMDDTNQTKGTAPSADVRSAVTFRDANGNLMGRCRQLYNSSKTNTVELQVHKANASSDTDSATMGIKYPSNGSAYGFAPASDVNGSILTTVNKSKSSNGYFQLGNGLIIQWGHFNKQSGTVSFPKAFTNTNYALAQVQTESGSVHPNVAFNTKTTTGFNILNAGGVNNHDWIAIGY